MAAPLNKRQTQHQIDGIQTSKLIKRVQAHALGELDMANTELKAAEMLLSRTLPVLQRQEIQADVTGLTVNLISQSGNKPTDDHS